MEYPIVPKAFYQRRDVNLLGVEKFLLSMYKTFKI